MADPSVDKIPFSWYAYYQRLLLLYYLLTRSEGCKDKLCGLFLRAKGCHGAWESDAFTRFDLQETDQEKQCNPKLEVGSSV